MDDMQDPVENRFNAYHMGRKRRGDIRIFLLWALSDHPMHGYELMQFLGEKTYGMWNPSPGSVYPTLELLETEGLVTSSAQDGKKTYTLTPEGKQVVESVDKMNAGQYLLRVPELRAPIKELRETNMAIRHLTRSIIAHGTAADLRETAKIMREARTKLLAVHDRLPAKR